MNPGRYLGVDVGGTNVRAVVMEGGQPAELDRQQVARDYASLVDQIVDLSTRAGPGLRGIGIGLPGIAHEDTVNWVPNLPFLDGRPLAAQVEQRSGLPVFLANDAQLALLAEVRLGAARESRSAALVSIGTGIGGAIWLAGRIYRGAHGSAGAFGWLNLGRNAPLDPVHGQLELLASGSALERYGASLRPPLSAPELVAEARRGIEEPSRLVARAARDLGIALAGLASALDPDVIVLSGGVSEAFETFAARISEAVREFASPVGKEVPIVTGALDSLAGAIGAAVVADEREGVFLA
jgi:predicted NBD/HSP70 family sugar kinase